MLDFYLFFSQLFFSSEVVICFSSRFNNSVKKKNYKISFSNHTDRHFRNSTSLLFFLLFVFLCASFIVVLHCCVRCSHSSSSSSSSSSSPSPPPPLSHSPLSYSPPPTLSTSPNCILNSSRINSSHAPPLIDPLPSSVSKRIPSFPLHCTTK